MKNCRFRAVVEAVGTTARRLAFAVGSMTTARRGTLAAVGSMGAARRLAFAAGGVTAAGRLALAVGGVVVAARAAQAAADLSAPLDKIAVRDVAAGATVTEAESVGVVSETGILVKKGEGAYVLPANRILDNATVKMVAAEGTFTYAFTSGVETVSEPTAVLNRANMWLDASNAGSLTFEDDDAVKVGTWRDVRDVRDGTDVHPRAVTSHRYYVSRSPEKTVYEGRDAIGFGGAGSGRYMVWRKPDGSTNAVKAAHVFLVAGVTNKLAWIVGSTMNGGFDTRDNGLWRSHMALTERGRVWVNGRIADVFDTSLTKGYQLLEMDMGALTTEEMDSFFNCRNYQATNETGLGDTNAGNRAGGDLLCEVVVFTEPLTDRERLAVEAYLLQKWSLDNTSMRGLSAASAEAAQAVFRVDETTGDAIELLGEGVVVKQGASDAYVLPSLNGGVALSPKPATPQGGMDATRARINSFDGQGRTFQGKVKVATGGVYVNAPVALDVNAGDAITATPNNQGNKVTVASGTAGTVVKKGTGEAVLQDLPTAAERLTVDAGRLVLKAPAKADVGLGVNPNAGAKVALANAGFEDVTFPGDRNYLNLTTNSSLCAGWTVTIGRAGNNRQAGISGKKSATQGEDEYNGAYNLPPPHSGNAQLVLQVSAVAETSVAIPADGFYDLSFWMAGTGWTDGDSYLGLDVSLVAPNGATTTVGRAYAMRAEYAEGRAYRLVRFRTPYLTAGEGWTLRFATSATKQTGFVIDDIDLTCLPDLPDSRIIPLPNGDFETYAGSSYIYYDRVGATNNTAEGWTFTQPEDYSPTKEGHRAPRAGLIFGNRPYRESWMDGQRFGVNYGEAALTFAGAGGVATSSSMVLSAGTYYLRGTVAARTMWNYGSASEPYCVFVSAKVTTSQGTVDLGTVKCIKQIPETRRWPIGFTVAEGETVTFSLSGGNERIALVDDLVLVKSPAPVHNLLSNGDFETDSGEVLTVWEQTVGTGASKVQRLKHGEWYDTHYARGYFEGAGYARLVGTVAISQTVTVPSAGIYRFTMHEHTRVTGGSMPGIRVTLTDADGVEVEILRIEPNDDIAHEIVRWTRDFRIARAGDYTLRIATLEENGRDKSSQLDDVSLVKVDETATEAAPALSDQTIIEVKEGATLALDFPGTLTVRRLVLGGKRCFGTITAAQFPAYLSGPGEINVPRRGTVLIYR